MLRASEKIAARSLLNTLGVQTDNDGLVSGAEQAVTAGLVLLVSRLAPARPDPLREPGDRAEDLGTHAGSRGAPSGRCYLNYSIS